MPEPTAQPRSATVCSYKSLNDGEVWLFTGAQGMWQLNTCNLTKLTKRQHAGSDGGSYPPTTAGDLVPKGEAA